MILLDPDARPLVAHRGASGEYPENTLLAFEQGLAQGADALEFDVRLTADQRPAVIHDPMVDRTTDGSGLVQSFRACELADLDAGRGQGIPTLDAVLDGFPDTPLIIEIKDEAAAEVVAEALRRHDAAGRSLAGAFGHRALRPFAPPEFARVASRRETAIFWLASRFRWAPTGSRYGAFTVPERHKGLRVVDRAFLAAASRRRKPVHVWTINERSEAARLRALGVAGIMTDFPSRMRGLAATGERSA